MRLQAILSRFRCVSDAALLFLLPAIIGFGCKQKEQEPESEEPTTEVGVEEKTETARADKVPAGPAGEVFEMEEVSVFDIGTPSASQLQRGQPSRDCGLEPNSKVKAYPEFKSDKPFYGTATFDMSLVQYGFGIDYYFALDESGGAGTGYDRLYFDTNHDLDLTNDGALSPMENPPAQLTGKNRPNQQEVAFDYLQFDLDYGPAKPAVPLKVIPRFMLMSTRPMVTFALPTARKGKIKLGSKEFEAVLAQSMAISGSYASPMTGLFLGETPDALPFLCGWRNIDGTLYTLSSTASGDKLTVTAYTGPFGLFEVAGDSDGKEGKVELGYLLSEDAIIDIGKCPKEDGQPKIPVGDYRPLRLGVRLGDLRVGLGIALLEAGETPTKPPAFGIKIRENKPYVLDLASKPEIVFKTPAVDERFKVGSEIKVEALVYDPKMDASIAALEDATRKIGENIKLPDGTEYERFESIDPMVKITNSSGECVAEGKMPFG